MTIAVRGFMGFFRRSIGASCLAVAMTAFGCGGSTPAPSAPTASAPSTKEPSDGVVAVTADGALAGDTATTAATATAPEDAAASVARAPSKIISIADFNTGGALNLLKGRYATFLRAPSDAVIAVVRDIKHGADGGSLKMKFKKMAGSFCGMWMKFAPDGKYLDASATTVLAFHVRGEKGGENFDIGVSDRTWDEKEDSVMLGNIGDFLTGGVTTDWKRVAISIDDPRLDLKEINGFSVIAQDGAGVIFIDNVQLESK